MVLAYNRKIILEDGSEYPGYGFGDLSDRVCEIVFNTSMVGYQEIVSDPSYTYQAVVMTYPLIGNYGVNFGDNETFTPSLGALVVGECCPQPSNFRSEDTLSCWLKKCGIPAIEGVDTRKLARSIRDYGSRMGIITAYDVSAEEGVKRIQAFTPKKDAVKTVSCKKAWQFPCSSPEFKVAAIDCGIKHNILRSLSSRGCAVTVFPYDTPASEILKMSPDGVFLSNGPGDPQDVVPVIELIKAIKGKVPMFGICLGHQLTALAYGAETYKLKFGHRGGNHPVKNLLTGKVEITSQNHSFAVDAQSVKGTKLQITHINLLDNTVEGLKCDEDKVFTVQYHPESAPGPEDSGYLFDQFTALMRK